MMTHANKEAISSAVERIRTQVKNTSVSFGNSKITATASFGIAGFRVTKSADWNILVACANSARYAAKHKRRNRIEFE